MAIDDELSKEELYFRVVKDPCKGRILKEPKFEIIESEIDEIYLNIKKFQRGLNQELLEDLKQYLDTVESGYVGNDFIKFEKGVHELMKQIYLI